MATKETKDVLAGKYGKTAKPVDPELQKKALGDDAETDHVSSGRSDPG